MTAADVLARLKASHPGRFTATHLRTTQRMVKAWRAVEARRMIRLGTTALTLGPNHRVVVPAPSPAIVPGDIPA